MSFSDVFAKVVTELHGHISGKHRLTMLMWADRLIDGDEFNMGEWEASKVGTAPAADKIPKDIILCPWHYEPRAKYEADTCSVPGTVRHGMPSSSTSR